MIENIQILINIVNFLYVFFTILKIRIIALLVNDVNSYQIQNF